MGRLPWEFRFHKNREDRGWRYCQLECENVPARILSLRYGQPAVRKGLAFLGILNSEGYKNREYWSGHHRGVIVTSRCVADRAYDAAEQREG